MNSSDAGFTLLETLMAVIILSIAVVVIAGGMGVSVLASDRHRTQAEAHAVVLQAVEGIKSSEVAYKDCADPGDSASVADYLDAARDAATLPTGWTEGAIQITAVQYYDGAGFTLALEDCDPANPWLRLQLITVEVTSPDDRDVERLSFVKGSA